ncbi:MAG: YceI family protein [Deltaproteobacteria bacterium]|nr:YceI family protein [Deltaproteobacteria bacterium]
MTLTARFFAFLALLFFLPAPAFSLDYSIVPGKGIIRFTSVAPMETVKGETGETLGTVSFDPANLANARGTFSVNAASFKTGNRLRDRNMRNSFLEVARFPRITFDFKNVPGGSLANGTLTLHGVSLQKKIPVHVKWDKEGKTLSVKSDFAIQLSEFGIERPKILWLRLSDQVKVDVDLLLAP